MNILSLFDGISCLQLALNKACIDYNKYYASEIDKYAIQITQKNYPETIQLGDIKDIDTTKLPHIDLLAGGFSCQSFSIAGKRKGFNDKRGQLFYDLLRIHNIINPKWFLYENVASMSKENKAIITNALGVEPVIINSDRFVCQNRERIYWTNIPILSLPERPEWNKQYYQWRRTYFRENKSGVCPCLTANMGTGGHNVPLHSMDLRDKLTPEECEALQGMPRGYTSGISNTQRYKAIGNGFTVDVISHILSGIDI